MSNSLNPMEGVDLTQARLMSSLLNQGSAQSVENVVLETQPKENVVEVGTDAEEKEESGVQSEENVVEVVTEEGGDETEAPGPVQEPGTYFTRVKAAIGEWVNWTGDFVVG
eukprot:Trichotokara_eunicae@DN5834_c0_g1_i3.p1